MTDIPTAPRVTFTDLLDLADRHRQRAEAWVRINTERAVKAQARADVSGTADAAIYESGAKVKAAEAAQFEALQKLVARCDGSETIKAELKRIAEIERAASAPAAGEDDNHAEG